MVLTLFFGLPLALGAGYVILLIRGERKGLLLSALTFCSTAAAGFWSIAQSRASTAGIGVLFLPGYGAVAGLLAWLFARFRQHPNTSGRAAAWLCILASVGLPVVLVTGGFREQAKNRERDRKYADDSRRMGENRASIRELVRQNPGRETAALEAEIEKHRGDRTFLIPALEMEFVSEDTLDRLSRSSDLGIVLMVARHQHARAQTLDWIYRNSTYPPYFFQALAENKNTNAEILRKLFSHPEPQFSLAAPLSRNPSTPRDILEKLANSADIQTLQGLLKNAALDCELLRKVKGSVARSNRPDDQFSTATVASLELRLCSPK